MRIRERVRKTTDWSPQIAADYCDAMRSRATRFAGVVLSLWSLVVTGGHLTAHGCAERAQAAVAAQDFPIGRARALGHEHVSAHDHSITRPQSPPADAPDGPGAPCHCPGCVCGCVSDTVLFPVAVPTLEERFVALAASRPATLPAATAVRERRPHALPFASGPPSRI